jgi:hypothetical protein
MGAHRRAETKSLERARPSLPEGRALLFQGRGTPLRTAPLGSRKSPPTPSSWRKPLPWLLPSGSRAQATIPGSHAAAPRVVSVSDRAHVRCLPVAALALPRDGPPFASGPGWTGGDADCPACADDCSRGAETAIPADAFKTASDEPATWTHGHSTPAEPRWIPSHARSTRIDAPARRAAARSIRVAAFFTAGVVALDARWGRWRASRAWVARCAFPPRSPATPAGALSPRPPLLGRPRSPSRSPCSC